jgi:hypothetical protein
MLIRSKRGRKVKKESGRRHGEVKVIEEREK